MTNEIQLKVVEALQDDAYKGIARVDAEIMRELGVKRGDAILIKGNGETVAIVDRAYPNDSGEGIIRIDGIIRRNAKTGIGDSIKILKAEVKEAKKIIIAPAQKGIIVQGDPKGLKEGLLGRIILKGDILIIQGSKKRKNLFSDNFDDMDDIFGNLSEMFEGFEKTEGISQIKFLVVDTQPIQPVAITDKTEIILKNTAIQNKMTEEEIRKKIKESSYLLKLKAIPDLKNFYELENLQELDKLIDNKTIINYYQKRNKEYFLVGSYFVVKTIISVANNSKDLIGEGIAMKTSEIKEKKGIIRIDESWRRELKIKLGEKIILKSMMINKSLTAIVGEDLPASIGEGIVGMNKDMLDELAIYKDGYVLMKKDY